MLIVGDIANWVISEFDPIIEIVPIGFIFLDESIFDNKLSVSGLEMRDCAIPYFRKDAGIVIKQQGFRTVLDASIVV